MNHGVRSASGYLVSIAGLSLGVVSLLGLLGTEVLFPRLDLWTDLLRNAFFLGGSSCWGLVVSARQEIGGSGQPMRSLQSTIDLRSCSSAHFPMTGC